MRINLFNILPFAAVALLGYALTLYFDQSLPSFSIPLSTQQSKGEPAPDFTFKTIENKSYALKAFKGKVIIINFWATWCPPCVKEFPALIKIAKAHPHKVVLIALSSDMDDAALTKFLKSKNYNFPNILIGRDKDQSITQNLFQTYSLPETYVIDGRLRIRQKFIGGDWKIEDFNHLIDNL